MSRVRRLANPSQVERLTSELWDKHGRADRHGYIDWMSEDGFAAAVTEVIDRIDAGEFRLPREERSPRKERVSIEPPTRILVAEAIALIRDKEREITELRYSATGRTKDIQRREKRIEELTESILSVVKDDVPRSCGMPLSGPSGSRREPDVPTTFPELPPDVMGDEWEVGHK